MENPEPPPQYVEYPRPHLPKPNPDAINTDLFASWALAIGGIPLTPIIGIFCLIPVNRAVRVGCLGARASRIAQIVLLIISAAIWFTIGDPFQATAHHYK